MMSTAVTVAYVSAACAGAVTLIAAFRGWRSIAIWFFAAGMVLLAAESTFTGLATDAALVGEAFRWQEWRLISMSFLPGVWLLFSLSYARGNYRQFFNKWRYILVAAVVLPVLVAVISPARLLFSPVDMNEGNLQWLNMQWVFRLQPAGSVVYILFLISTVMVMMNLERTFRAAVGTMRWHIKFMILGLGVLFAARAYTASQALLSGRMNPALVSVDCGALLLGCLLMLRSLFRDVSEVAVLPSHGLLENSLTALVAGIYFVVVGVYIKLVPVVNAASFQAKAFFLLVLVVGTTVVALSERVRMRTRRFLSRSFQRPLYDYRTVWRTLTEGIGSRVKQQDFCQTAVTLVSDIFKVLAVTMWLVDDKREDLLFAASTSLSAAAGDSLRPQKEEALAIIQALHNQSEPVDIETAAEEWAAALRRLNPTRFRTGGRRVCVPLRAGGHLIGMIVLGDRVGGIHFSLQDFDLLRCVGDQVAAGLLNAELSQKLLQAKELEAFQTMSAFFVHDLKNTASTINLMLQNLPVHFDNPEFREDALRGVAKTCDHINHLISRLSLLRHDLQIKPAQADLNDVVGRVLAGWSAVNGVTLIKNLRACPPLPLDREQIFKVVTNLVINATEAVSTGGVIRVETSQNNGWAVVTVADNGCGMAPEFLNRALFRPFQTTKKEGFGIGMFQSKMIVEAHGGRIEVESELQKGTVFKVLLPLQTRTA
jgi:putative PEP-CTERM system histidine kinase